jgi:uncharacterized membrane protein
MSQLVVLSFERAEEAGEALRSIRQVERAGQLQLEDTAIVTKDADGKVRVNNEVSGATETGAVIGAILGPMLMFLFPIAGIAIGAGAGALVGRLFNTGVDGKFVKEVKEQLTPGTSALFLVIKGGNPEAGVAALRPYQGQVLQTTLDPDLEAEVRRALE